jgi:hydrogenase nickel incorporation protein HypA/HybF
MHEAGLMQTALELAAAHARAAGAVRIHRLCLRVGDLSGVVPEALEFAFRALSVGGPAEGAVLEIERVPATIHDAADGPWETVRDGAGGRSRNRRTDLELTALEVS